jgi:signal transduction histidine kinase
LQFSRQRSTERWPSDLNEIVERAIELTGKYIEQRGAAVRTELRAPLPKVKLNPGQIEQVLVNLIQNAVESGEGVRVVVSTRSATGRVRVAVQDDGRGMTEEQKSHLFDPFFTTREREGGTGLGLSIAHGIVTSHGGTIDVESEPGRGTMILVELPVAR